MRLCFHNQSDRQRHNAAAMVCRLVVSLCLLLAGVSCQKSSDGQEGEEEFSEELPGIISGSQPDAPGPGSPGGKTVTPVPVPVPAAVPAPAPVPDNPSPSVPTPERHPLVLESAPEDFAQDEDAALVDIQVTATDADLDDSVLYEFDTDAMTCDDGGWDIPIAIDEMSGMITGTPANAAVGSCTVVVKISSSDDALTHEFTITVNNTNDLPVWNTLIGDFSVNEDSSVAKTALATDVDVGQTPLYSLDTANMSCDDGAWSPQPSIDPVTGALSGMPTNADVGTCTIKIDAVSGADKISEIINVTVLNTNDLPVWTQEVASFAVAYGLTVSKNVQAQDVDTGDTPVYAINSGASTCDDGAWSQPIAVNAAGHITGVASAADVGSCLVRIDAVSGSDTISTTFTITVSGDVTPPDNPGSVTNVAFVTTQSMSPTINWAASASPDLSHYEIALGTTSGATDVVGWTNVGTSQSHQFTGMNLSGCPSVYYAVVRAVDQVGNPSSGTVSTTPFGYDDGTPPSVPTNLTVLGDASLTASDSTSWTAATDNCAVSHYQVAVSLTTDEDGIIPGGAWKNTGAGTTGRISTGIAIVANTDHYTLVRAVDHAGVTSSPISVSPAWQLFQPSTQLPNMIAWLDAADHATLLDSAGRGADDPAFNGVLSTWKDKSGSANVHDFTIVGASNPAVAADPDRVMFDGSDYLTTADHNEINLTTVQERNITLAFRTGSNTTAKQVIYEEGGGVRGMNVYIAGGQLYCGFWNIFQDGDGLQNFTSVSAPVDPDTVYAVTWVFDYTNYAGASGPDGTLACYVNGVSIGSVPSTTRLFGHSGDVGLGGMKNDSYFHDGIGSGEGHYFMGDIMEVMLFNDPPSASTVSVVHGYLAGKWGQD